MKKSFKSLVVRNKPKTILYIDINDGSSSLLIQQDITQNSCACCWLRHKSCLDDNTFLCGKTKAYFPFKILKHVLALNNER